ncbi:hypothetical protein ACJX0J_037643, partial [Zea mays]
VKISQRSKHIFGVQAQTERENKIKKFPNPLETGTTFFSINLEIPYNLELTNTWAW